MADKFQNKYRIPSARLQTWDYRGSGAHFITICTKNRSRYFGKVTNKKMELTNVGLRADEFWHEIKNHSKNITLSEFIVMPNHIHCILIINANPDDISNSDEIIDDSNSNQHANAIHNRITEPRVALLDSMRIKIPFTQHPSAKSDYEIPEKTPFPQSLAAINLP